METMVMDDVGDVATAEYGARMIKRKRRSRAEIAKIRDFLRELVLRDGPMTIRHAFYRTVSAKLIEKTEAEYKNTVCRLLVQLRRAGELPYKRITDGTRWQIKPRSYDDLDSALQEVQCAYRRAFWKNQAHYVEVWCEKDAIAGILSDVTRKWDVPLMVCRGYPSLSFLNSIADDIIEIKKPTFVYYFGDHDPSGKDIRRFVEKEVRGFAPDAEIHFEMVAVTPEQIGEYDLPTRPTKTTDTRAKKFTGESVEIDAIEPRILKRLAKDCITRHVDQVAYRASLAVEQAEKDTLAAMIAGFRR